MKRLLAVPARRCRALVLFPLVSTLVWVGMLAACGGGDMPAVMATPTATTTPPPASPAPAVITCTPPPEGPPPVASELAATGRLAAVGGTIAGRADASFILFTKRSIWTEGQTLDRVMAYGPDLAASPVISGYIESSLGGYWCSSPDLTPYNGYDYPLQTHTYLHTTSGSPAPTISGSIRYPSATYAFSGGPLPGVASSYLFGQAASIADVAGSWSLHDSQGRALALTVADNGALTGSYRGCTLNGTLGPDPKIAGQFDLYFEPREIYCLGPASANGGAYPWNGLVIAYPLASGGWQMLLWAESTDSWEWHGLALAIGRR